MLLQVLDCYRSINQVRIQFLIDLLFHVLEFYNEFFDFIFIYLILTHLKVLSFSSNPFSKASSLFFPNTAIMILMNVYTCAPLFNTPRNFLLFLKSYVLISILDHSKNSGILQRVMTLVLLFYDCMTSKYSKLKSFLKINLMHFGKHAVPLGI